MKIRTLLLLLLLVLLPLVFFTACGRRDGAGIAETGAQVETGVQETGARVESVAGETADQEVGPNKTQIQLMDVGFQVFKEPIEAPDFTLRNVNGGETSLSSFKGKAVLLNFWATWCPPCRSEMPSMQLLYDELKDEGIELLAVDLQEPEKTVRTFLEENGYSFPVLLDTDGKIGAMYGARSIPQTYLIDPEGFAVAVATGAREWDSEQLYDALRMVASGE